jgi:hypothetical protein
VFALLLRLFLHAFEGGNHFGLYRTERSEFVPAGEADKNIGVERLGPLEFHSGIPAFGTGNLDLHVLIQGLVFRRSLIRVVWIEQAFSIL